MQSGDDAAASGLSRRLRDILGLAGLALIVGPILLYDARTAFPGLAALPPCLGTVLILWAGTGARGPVTQLLSLQPLVFIGLIPYSLYLWHWPVQVAMRRMDSGVSDLSSEKILVSTLLAGVAAWISWRVVERPFRACRV